MNSKGNSRSMTEDMNIIATLGPSTNTKDKIKALRQSGANFFRLNFSHGTVEDHQRMADLIREVDAELGTQSSILADLQGPKIRIGAFEEDESGKDEIALTEDMVIRFDSDPAPGNQERVFFPHPDVIEALEIGSHILLDDGNVYMEIVDKGADWIDAKVLNGKKLSSRKGVNVPDVFLPMPALTQKDRKDLRTALDIGVDYIALSFVQKPEDVIEAQGLIQGKAKLISKIEKPQALINFEEIMEHSDGIMVARGDLGVEIPLEHVPGVQREIVKQAREAEKFVIVATHMLDSMIKHSRPTRAETNDVSTAIKQGANAVMLSGETAVGKNPQRAVEVMRRIIETTQLEMNHPEQYLNIVFWHATNPADEASEALHDAQDQEDQPEIKSGLKRKPK